MVNSETHAERHQHRERLENAIKTLVNHLALARKQRDEARSEAAKLRGELDLWLKIQK